MKLSELGQSKITKLQPGTSAEIDHGDGTKTTVDLKKQPNALQKDAATGKVKMNKSNSAGKTDAKTTVKPGDTVELDEKEKANKVVKLGRPTPSKK